MALVLGAVSAHAQVPGSSTTTTTQRSTTTTVRRTTTTTADPAYATTTTTRPSTTTTIQPGDEPDGGSRAPGPEPGRQPSQGGGGGQKGGSGAAKQGTHADGDGGNPAARIVPPGFQSLINSVRRTRANDTAALLAALRPLEDFGLTPQKAALVGMGRFPVAGYSRFIDDWWFPRYTPVFHLHEGTDIFAARDTPVRASVDGVIRQANETVGGLSVYLTQGDGTYFYYTHLSAFVSGQRNGQVVKTGEVIGFVGDTGNARGGAPHVHMELHPRGGGPVNPKPFLDRFVSEAMANVPNLIAAYEQGRPRVMVTTGLTRRMSEGRNGVFAAPQAPSRSHLLWASAASQGGALELARAAGAEAARHVDWDSLSRREQERQVERAQADERARSILAPTTPAALGRFIGLERRVSRSSTLVAAPSRAAKGTASGASGGPRHAPPKAGTRPVVARGNQSR